MLSPLTQSYIQLINGTAGIQLRSYDSQISALSATVIDYRKDIFFKEDI